jgi:hypothetical protein
MLKSQISDLEIDTEIFQKFKKDIHTLTTKSQIGQKTKLESNLDLAENLKQKMINLRQNSKNQKLKIDDLEEEIIEHKEIIRKLEYELEEQTGN